MFDFLKKKPADNTEQILHNVEGIRTAERVGMIHTLSKTLQDRIDPERYHDLIKILGQIHHEVTDGAINLGGGDSDSSES